MAREFGKVTRISVMLTVLVALVMLAAPVLQIGGKSVSPVGDAAAANGSRVFNVGIVDLTGSVATLNPFIYTMSSEFDIIWPCYSTLLTYDINAKQIGDLATTWKLAPDGLTWNFKLANNAYFIDPAAPTSTAHRVTATDVMWTFWELNNDTKNHLSSYFNTGGVGLIDSMWTGVDQFDLFVKTKTPYAPFLGALTTIPIVPEYIWNHLSGGKTPTTYANLPPIGSGAFYYGTVGLPTSGVAIMKRNPQWFQEANRGWQLHIDTLQYKNEMTTAQAWTELTMTPPLIDTYLNVAPTQYVANLINTTTPGVMGWAQSTGFVYEYQLNQLSLSDRQAYGMHSGYNNQLLLNPTVKLAMAMCVNKQSFIDQVVMGLGSVADSLVPDVNPWHYDYPTPVVYNPVAARALLMAAGWDHAADKSPATSTTVPLYKYGVANNTVYQPLSFRMLTLTTNPEWGMGSSLLKQWAALGGVELILEPVSTNQANSAWYAGNYDTWLWDWVFTPTSDPSTDCLQVDTTMAIGTWSGSYWRNSTFDALYNRSLLAMDPVARRQLTDQLQAMIYEDHNDQLIAYTKYLYAANTANWYGPSYGDWAAHWTLMPDQGYPWLYMQLSPTNNHAPTVTVGSSSFSGSMGASIPVFGSATDVSTLKYQWYWGDGAVSGWQTSASQSHTYVKDGIYTAYFAAQEQGTGDLFISSDTTTITVIDTSNRAPTISSIGMVPSSGVNTGTNVQFTANAVDLDGDVLSYNWNFGDTYTGTGQIVTHQFTTVGTYTVTLSVDDGHPGAGRPATATKLVSVTLNHPPAISIQSSQATLWKTTTFFNATASDSDGDTLRYTWNWGDGSTLVTTTPLMVTHVYSQKGTNNLRVFADDLTGLSGHNVSALDVVSVIGTPSPPTALTLGSNITTVFVSRTVSFTATAKDPTGDAMRFTFAFGDGSYANVNTPETTNNKLVTARTNHTYWSPGVLTVRLYVTDGQDNTTGPTVSLTVVLNSPPVVTPLTNKVANAGASVSFSVIASDPDLDTLQYTWNFGDGSPLLVRTTNTATHTYVNAGTYTFRVYVNDMLGLAGHNVSSSATASIAFNLPLTVGWNFISVPLVGFGYKASTIGLALGDVVVAWNSTTQSYDHNYIKLISPPSADFSIAQNTGYWIWVAAAKTLHLQGSVPTGLQSQLFTVPVGGGWVAVGFATLNTTRHAADIVTMYSGPPAKNITLVAKYTGTAYVTYIKGTPLNNFLLVPGQAYWCWAEASGVLTYMP